MPERFEFHSSQVVNLSETKMLVYRAICAITSRNHEVKVSKASWWAHRHQEEIGGFDFRQMMLRQQPSDWSILIPVEIDTHDARVVYVGVFIKHVDKIVRASITTNNNDVAIDFDSETGRPTVDLKIEDL
jgi:hypothetical protein